MNYVFYFSQKSMELNKEISFLGNYLATQHEPYFASFNKLRRHLLHETYSTLRWERSSIRNVKKGGNPKLTGT